MHSIEALAIYGGEGIHVPLVGGPFANGHQSFDIFQDKGPRLVGGYIIDARLEDCASLVREAPLTASRGEGLAGESSNI